MSRTRHTRQYLTIGQIAARSGVSAKALRLYEQRGLLKPCAHSQAGYRLYGPVALARLMQILVLKRSGFSLMQIAGLQAQGAQVVATLLEERIRTLQHELAEKTQALATLQRLAGRVGSTSDLDLNQLLESLTMTDQIDSPLDPHQRERILARVEHFAVVHSTEEQVHAREAAVRQLDTGGDALRAAQHEWRELGAQVRAAMAAGTSAADPSLKELAQRWWHYLAHLSERDPTLLAKLRKAYLQHPELMDAQSMSPAMMDYMHDAMAVAGLAARG